jgi:cation diffusion facilitator CzcD-associated flavoprotein CzcO
MNDYRDTLSSVEHVDVIIVGAGLSGVGAACHLKMECPQKSFVILEGRDTMGGTWDLFRYPGVRSDSDMYTLGYPFRPWRDPRAIADGDAILSYIRQTAAEYEIDKSIRYNHRVRRVSWSTDHARWTVEAEVGPDVVQLSCNFLFLCTGYYDYENGYTPEWPGVAQFRGTIVHPQKWPEDLDYSNKRIVVIGSGATAITLAPALAQRAAHVTMLQRSPSYVITRPAEDPLARLVRRCLPVDATFALMRWKNVLVGTFFYDLARKRPAVFKWLVAKGVRNHLGNEYDARHFTPPTIPGTSDCASPPMRISSTRYAKAACRS